MAILMPISFFPALGLPFIRNPNYSNINGHMLIISGKVGSHNIPTNRYVFLKNHTPP